MQEPSDQEKDHSLRGEPAEKRARIEDGNDGDDDDDALCELVWNHFEAYQQSVDESSDQMGDTDELAEIIEILSNKKKSIEPCTDLSKVERCVDLLPVLWSAASHLLADVAIGELLPLSDANNQGAKESEIDEKIHEIDKLLKDALHYFPLNASTWSMAANYGRMIVQKGGKSVPLHTRQLLTSPMTVANWYQHAAACAQQVRSHGLELLEKEDESQDGLDVKPWIESLLMNCVVGVEWIPDDGDDEEADGAQDEEGIGSDDSEEEEKDSEEIGGAWSGSATEATSHFMAAMQLSIAGKHDEALTHLQEFPLTHRLHPNLWKQSKDGNTNGKSTSGTEEGPLFVFGGGNESNGVLPPHLYQQLCKVFKPSAPYWTESSYTTRGYYSYFMDKEKPVGGKFSNLIYEVIQGHLLPKVQSILDKTKQHEQIVGFEWWAHTRPLGANLGHNLHFDTDEALLSQEGKVTHPIYSSVLYLTGEQHGGPTLVLDQTPDSRENAPRAWSSSPKDNTFLIFPGNMLHGVLPCSSGSKDEPATSSKPSINDLISSNQNGNATNVAKHRLTFMVGFWTRRVPDKMKDQKLYGPCGPLPPATEDHSWVQQIERGYKDRLQPSCDPLPCKATPIPSISPVWQKIVPKEKPEAEALQMPKAIDHRFFVEDAPECFREALFEDIECRDLSHNQGYRMTLRVPLMLMMLAMAIELVSLPFAGYVEAADFPANNHRLSRELLFGRRQAVWGTDLAGSSQRTTYPSAFPRGGSSLSGTTSKSTDSSNESSDQRKLLEMGGGDPFVQAAPFVLAMTANDGSVAMVAAHSLGGLEEMEPLLYQSPSKWSMKSKQLDDQHVTVKSTSMGEEVKDTPPNACRNLLDLPDIFGGPMRIQTLGSSLALLTTGWRADCDTLVDMGRQMVADERDMLGSSANSNMLGCLVATQISESMAQLVSWEGDRALSCTALVVHSARTTSATTDKQSRVSVWLVDPSGVYPVRALAIGQHSNFLNQKFLANEPTLDTAQDCLKAFLEKLHGDPTILPLLNGEATNLRLELSIMEVNGSMKRVKLEDILPGISKQ